MTTPRERGTFTYLREDVTMRVWRLPGPIAPIGEPLPNPPDEDVAAYERLAGDE